MFYVLICLAIALAIVLVASYLPHRSRTHCRCGRRADIIDHERPWKVWCGRCWLRKARLPKSE